MALGLQVEIGTRQKGQVAAESMGPGRWQIRPHFNQGDMGTKGFETKGTFLGGRSKPPFLLMTARHWGFSVAPHPLFFCPHPLPSGQFQSLSLWNHPPLSKESLSIFLRLHGVSAFENHLALWVSKYK